VSTSVICTEGLVKQYGAITALRGLSLRVEKGEIFGLLGPNGAGKSTLLKVLLGIISATDGSAELLGQPAGTASVRKRVGYLPEDHRFPDYHTGASLLDFYGALLEVPKSERRKRIPAMLELVGLKGRMHYKIRTYSKGMKQRLGIAQALINEPEIIFLDEPTDGVDPRGRREIRDLMESLQHEGKTIFLNSHLLGEVEQVCDRVAILNRGDKVREGDVKTLTQQKGWYELGLAPGQELPVEEVTKLGYQAKFAGSLWEIGLSDGQTIDPVVSMLVGRGLHVRHLVEKRVSLEDLFMQATDAAEPGVDTRRIQRGPEERVRPE
jgi:ABC-2 type transport system ATP-binding protein